MKHRSAHYCDFVIWSPKGFFQERIFPDEHFWELHFPKALEFQQKVLLPELLGRYFTKGRYFQQRWCICQEPDNNRIMIQCDNDDCDIQWFHLDCIGLTDIPENLWLSQNCSL